MKLCECGCGLPAPIAKRTSRSKGWVKGEPIRFINGHRARGPRRAVEVLRKLCDLRKLCECGCGLPTPIATQTHSRRGIVQGEPVRFLPGHHRRQDLGKRFWSKVDKNGPTIRPELGPCWIWTGYRDRAGYGVISVNNRNRRATHVALELAAGWILPFELSQVLHLCDNPPCCNPAHLKIDTQQGNTEDRDARGRQARLRGERNGQAKIHQQEADEIRLLYAAGGILQRVLARQCGINQARISDIVRGKTWIAEGRS